MIKYILHQIKEVIKIGKKHNLKKYLLPYLGIVTGNEKFAYIYIDGKRSNYVISSHGYVVNLNFKGTGIPHRMTEEYNHGYKRISILINGKIKHFRIHRLVAMAFIENPNNYPIILHNDNNKENNNVDNLSWGTNYQNTQDAKKDGLIKHGEDTPLATITNETAHKICKLLVENKLTMNEIARECNTSRSIVNSIFLKYTWKHISDQYDLSKHTIRINNPTKEDSVVELICELLSTKKYTNKEIAKAIGCKPYLISDIKQRKTYKNISKNYQW